MNHRRKMQRLARCYAATLQRHYAAGEREAVLEEAYELGRAAIAAGFGVLDMARVHLEARERMLRSDPDRRSRARISRLAGAFFLQTLSPFEATHRGFRETNDALQQRNRELEAEIQKRQRAEEALKNLSSKILHAQEEERRRISRELHDEVGQSLTAVSVTLAALRNGGASPSPDLPRFIAGAQRLLEATMETVHRFARELRPAMLDELGLLPALRSHVKNFSERTGLRIRLQADPVAEKLDGEQKTAVFRVAQESLTNVAKHARASRVKISLRRNSNGICMEIADNGRSFRADPETAARQKERLGLLGMQERVRLVNGWFSVQPEPGRGTTVRVIIPFQAATARG
jgi:two-component system, NarL family, sensor histidine kinase DegS